MEEPMNELKKAYLVLQENCGIKVGDTVKVLRKVKDDEGGWDNSWVQSMDEFIGKECTVVRSEDSGILLTCDEVECGNRGFPFFVLEKVKSKATTPDNTTISLRDQFAIAYAPVCSIEEFTPEGAADQCIRFADAMLKAREE